MLLQEFPGLDPKRLAAAVERATARAAAAQLDTEGHRIVDAHLARVEETEESIERATIMRQLAMELEGRGDFDRAMVVRLSAFGENPSILDLDPLLRLARATERTDELPLDAMTVLIVLEDPDAPRWFSEIAAAWQELGNVYRAADCYERVLLLDAANLAAYDALEVFYRSTSEWPVLIDLLQRRLGSTEDKHGQAELYREIAELYERELGDDASARDALRSADLLEPDHRDVLDGLARLAVRLGGLEDEALGALERTTKMTEEPKARARVLHRAAEIAKHHDYDKAQVLFERARAEDPDLREAVDGLVTLLRDRGDLAGSIELLVDAAARPAFAEARSNWLADAADFSVALGDTERAKTLYGEARVADPDNHHAGLALVELCWDTGAVVELAPILEELTRTTEEPSRLHGYLVQLARVSAELGDRAKVKASLEKAVAIDGGDSATRRELAELCFEDNAWAETRAHYEALLESGEAELSDDDKALFHFRIAVCASETGDGAAAEKHAGMALAIVPSHRPTLMLRAELASRFGQDPFALAADQLALANMAPVEERATRFAALGDTYATLGDPHTAREMYREALVYRPTDHMLLTKSLGLVVDEGDWSYSMDLVQRLIESEQDRAVRARYCHLAAMIARDNLDDDERAIELFERAIDDDPKLFIAADELEATLTVEREQLAAFYYKRLGHVRDDEGRPGERLRLWDRLGEVCETLDRTEDAVVAAQVGLSLDPDNFARRQRLAELYRGADPKHDLEAIAHHQGILAIDRRNAASYRALHALYRRTGQLEKARAVEDALPFVDGKSATASLGDLFDTKTPLPLPPADPSARRPLANEDWATLARDVDPHLTALFAIVAPQFAAERARQRPPRDVPGRDVKDRDLPPSIARVLAQVIGAFGVGRPPVYLDRDQIIASNVILRARDGVLAPVLIFGKPAIDLIVADKELAFVLARQLADLRSERIARLLCPRPGDLAQIIELASSPSTWLSQTFRVELEKIQAIGARLRERGVDPMKAGRTWRTATERVADRIGLVVTGDLAVCARMIEGTSTNVTSDLDRIPDLVWASVTEELLDVRGRVEGWRRRP